MAISFLLLWFSSSQFKDHPSWYFILSISISLCFDLLFPHLDQKSWEKLKRNPEGCEIPVSQLKTKDNGTYAFSKYVSLHLGNGGMKIHTVSGKNVVGI